MRVKIFNVRSTDLEDDINEYLKSLPKGHEVISISAGEGKVFVLHGPYESPSRRRSRRKTQGPDPAVCTQCRKNLAVEGKKTCEDCLQYQKEYRKGRKREKDDTCYLP